MQRALIQALSVLILAAGSSAGAQADGQDFNHLLQGDYAFAQQEVCVATPEETLPPTFDRNTLELVGEAETITLQSQGVTTFDGKGGWTAEGRGNTLRNNRTQPSDLPMLPPISFECEGTYSVNADRSIENFTGICTTSDGAIEFGPRTLSGHLGADRKTLVLADTAPMIEEIRLTDPDFLVGERVCSTIAVDTRFIDGTR